MSLIDILLIILDVLIIFFWLKNTKELLNIVRNQNKEEEIQ